MRQLPALTFSTKPEGILRGWDLTIERNEQPHICDNQSEPCFCECGPQYVNNGDVDDFSGHYTVEQASTLFFTNLEEGIAQIPSTP